MKRPTPWSTAGAASGRRDSPAAMAPAAADGAARGTGLRARSGSGAFSVEWAARALVPWQQSILIVRQAARATPPIGQEGEAHTGTRSRSNRAKFKKAAEARRPRVKRGIETI